MQTTELLGRLDQELLEKLYGFSYVRCRNHHEAEDLCSEILLQLVKSLQQGRQIQSFEAFCWKVAHNVYADFCEKRQRQQSYVMSQEEFEQSPLVQVNPVEEYLQDNEEQEQMKCLIREIASLGRIYRDVMVQYYLEEKRVSEIAENLHISETTVKQRLFSARNTIKSGMEQKQEKAAEGLPEPVYLNFAGSGNPSGNDPAVKAKRLLSQHVVYLCRNQERRASEIAEKLGVPLVYIEDELRILCQGANGTYGLLRRTGKEKYIANILLLQEKEVEEILDSVTGEVKQLIKAMQQFLQQKKARIEGLTYFGKRRSISDIFWVMITWVGAFLYYRKIPCLMAERYFPEQKQEEQEYRAMGITSHRKYEEEEFPFPLMYGCDEIMSRECCGYKEVHFQNLYGQRIQPKFRCGDDISMNDQMLLTVRALRGFPVKDLSEEEQETAAKAIADGYLVRDGEMLYPGIVAGTAGTREEQIKIAQEFLEERVDIVETLTEKLALQIRNQCHLV